MIDRPLAALASRRLWIYGGGLVAILGVRAVALPDAVRIGAVSFVLVVMGVTYVGERVVEGGRIDRPGLVAVGLAGIAAGSALALAGWLAGFVFLAGGLLFLYGSGTAGGNA